MNFRSVFLGLFPLVLVLTNGTTLSANAESTKNSIEFSIIYNTEFLFTPLEEDLQPESVEIDALIEQLPSRFQEALPTDLPSVLINPQLLDVTVSGESVNTDAAFGLTNFVSNTFGLPLPPQIDPQTGIATRQVSIFRANPADLNINLPTPEFGDIYFGGTTNNKLYGNANDQAIFDFVQGTVSGGGIITIVGGEGLFKNASGQITFTQQDRLGAPGEPVIGQARLDFSLEIPQSVPEPRTDLMLLGFGAMGVTRLFYSCLKHKN